MKGIKLDNNPKVNSLFGLSVVYMQKLPNIDNNVS